MKEPQTLSADVIVVGGGMVGSLTAAALASCGLDVIVLEQQAPANYQSASHDLRVSAISVATEQMFAAVGAWSYIEAMRLCPFRRMAVWDAETTAKTEFDSADIGCEHLGYIVENRVIQLGLWQRLQTLDNVRIHCPARIAGLSVNSDCAVVELDDQTTVQASLIVAADGAKSMVRSLSDIGTEGDFYDQHALVATVRTSLPQQDITWQCFTPDGPQAFLPLTENRASMVWYHSAEFIAELKNMPPEKFLRRMESEFPERLGGLEELIDIGSFPLKWQQAQQYVKPRIALVGDAAHSVHPLAGQGVNMGMLDAAALVECITERYGGGADIGSLRILRRYERWRKGSNALMIKMLDSIHRAFQPGDNNAALLKLLRGAALHGAEKIPQLNSLCMKMAMGLAGDLPALAKGRLPVTVARAVSVAGVMPATEAAMQPDEYP